MSEKEALQKAADEARKAARASRELGNTLDDYAKYLMQPSWQERADDLRRAALNKLSVIHDGLATCDKWREVSGVSAVARAPEQTAAIKVSQKQVVPDGTKPKTARVLRKGTKE